MSNNYWEDRFNRLENNIYKNVTVDLKEFKTNSDKIKRRLDKDIRYWVNRIAINNNIDYNTAKTLLDNELLEEFKYTLDDYIRIGEENSINAKWVNQLENMSSKYHISRLKSLQIMLENYTNEAINNISKTADKIIPNSYVESFYKSLYELEKGIGINHDLYAVDYNQLDILLHNPWADDGMDFSSRIWGKYRNELNTFLQQSMMDIIVRGVHPDKVIPRMVHKFKVLDSNAENLLRTETAYFSSLAQEKSFKILDVEMYQISATLDVKTSEICRGMDRKVFKMSDHKIGITAPPFHNRCRTSKVPYFDDLEGTRTYRDKTGKNRRIDRNISYKEWYEKYVKTDKEYLLQEKMWYNRHKDKYQYDKYKLSGVNVPKSFKEFQYLKYNNPEIWKDTKLRYSIKSEYNLKIHDGRQGKHIKGHNNYNSKGYLLESISPQDLIDKYAGTGRLVRDSNNKWTSKEMIIGEKNIGYYIDLKTKEKSITKKFSISYSKKYGTHIIPRKDE